MIHKVTNTKHLHDVYFEDINEVVSCKEEAYLVQVWYYYFFSTLEAAQEKARELGISEELV